MLLIWQDVQLAVELYLCRDLRRQVAEGWYSEKFEENWIQTV